MRYGELLSEYHRFTNTQLAGGKFITKLGVRGYPRMDRGVEFLLAAVELTGERQLDATSSAGAVAALAAHQSHNGELTVADPSMAALRCAAKSFEGSDVAVMAGTSWHAPPECFDRVFLAPLADRGTARVHAEVQGAQRALVDGGICDIVMHKDLGAKRYERFAAELFGRAEVVRKHAGWRHLRAVKVRSGGQAVEPISFTASGLELQAEPGVFAAGKLDPGTAVLLAATAIEELMGLTVLDLGCGYGLLALKASLAGAAVTAIDDDYTAVKSTYANARHYGLDLRCLHSDLDSALHEDDAFDAVLVNPPFHIGKRVELSLSRAFLAAGFKHLRPGGFMHVVANKALPYERDLEAWGTLRLLAEEDGFKVLRVVKRD